MSSTSIRGLLMAGSVAMSMALGAPAHAALLTSLAGDNDCFGLGGSCADGAGYVTDLGGAFFDDHSTAGDPLGTDAWNAWDPVSFDLAFNGTDAISAALQIRIAGVADSDQRGPYDVFFNGVNIGQISQNLDTNANQEVRTLDWTVPLALLQAHNTFSFTATDAGDGWSLDYVALTVDGTASSGAPEPATWAMMIGGFGLAGTVFRRRKAALA